ncbi:MAG: hypothetical protein COV08_02715 [Candidatus Vogelbacteria bacterium CG10_big_fil_rev_8_21_14_0_10_49_38]|uniref:DUF397 domain-containing protein n=1 Tax=Candidatus Vogelbacteria bacterium CG10_big_fil_rev_8_21_14_0_10_49_38 TaxID=1975043 RepID=A0A2H0RHF2_9BACT|nr:MAG: hypothetical protein BK006_02730 [bacterium CG10_49_38]PIR45856.1 MAG: hypothetical protein COV08_02715 [Candidatus Vogelbacteria bacterium CG10_big_fil_rev_8_21_14_0_10_49_38]
MDNHFGNGRPFSVNDRGQKVDDQGFATSSITFITNRRTCVSAKIGSDAVLIRNTEDPQEKTLSFSHEEWRAFIHGVKQNEFDLP